MQDKIEEIEEVSKDNQKLKAELNDAKKNNDKMQKEQKKIIKQLEEDLKDEK